METSVIMLYGLAADARANPSVLGDTMAEQAFARVDYDFGRLRIPRKTVASAVTARAKHFDDWTAEFLDEHPDAVVLNLGAGLDTRVFRLDPGPGVSWYDVDFPEVIEVRKELFPERENYRMIGSSVTDFGWLSEVPRDRPTLIVAQGLVMYLRPAEGAALLRRITEEFSSGTVAVETQNRLAVWLQNKVLTRVYGAPLLRWPIESAAEIERINPRLRRVDEVPYWAAAPAAGLPLASRIFVMLVKPVRALRDFDLYLRFTFDGGHR
jgi:O-methyltransferase involved in polyketide biosynthesis